MRFRVRRYRLGREGGYFPERLKRRRQFRVAVRSKVRRSQWADRIAILLLVSMGVASVVVMRHFPLDQIRLPELSSSFMPKALRLEGTVVDGAPPVLQERLLQALTPGHPWGLLEPHRAGKRLLQDFPCLRAVSYERDWRSHQVHFHVELQRPLARVTRNDRPWGWLSDGGRLFAAPAGVYPDMDYILVDLGRGGDASAASLARFVQDASKGGALPAHLVRAEFRSPEAGWKLTLADKTELLWGDLDWTDQKFSRLKEVLDDARMRGRVGWAADLRYFADGKILLRPKI